MAAFLSRMDAQWPRAPFQVAAPASMPATTTGTTAIENDPHVPGPTRR